MNEIWKLIPVEGNTTFYASDLGRIKNNNTGKIITPYNNHGGYLRFAIPYKMLNRAIPEGKPKSLKINVAVHRAVALAFIGEPPAKNSQVNHKDYDRTNNYLSNLEWITPKGNATHAAQRGKRKSRLTKEQVFFILDNPDFSYQDFVRKHNMTYSHVVTVRRGTGYTKFSIEYKKLKG